MESVSLRRKTVDHVLWPECTCVEMTTLTMAREGRKRDRQTGKQTDRRKTIPVSWRSCCSASARAWLAIRTALSLSLSLFPLLAKTITEKERKRDSVVECRLECEDTSSPCSPVPSLLRHLTEREPNWRSTIPPPPPALPNIINTSSFSSSAAASTSAAILYGRLINQQQQQHQWITKFPRTKESVLCVQYWCVPRWAS